MRTWRVQVRYQTRTIHHGNITYPEIEAETQKQATDKALLLTRLGVPDWQLMRIMNAVPNQKGG